MPRSKSINFYQNIPEIKLFLQKMQIFLCGRGSVPSPRASSGWVLCPQTLAAGSFAPRPPKQPLRCEFLATRRVFLLLLCLLFCVNWFCGSLVLMVFRKRLFLRTSLPTPELVYRAVWTRLDTQSNNAWTRAVWRFVRLTTKKNLIETWWIFSGFSAKRSS